MEALKKLLANPTLKKKILYTFAFLALYRFLVFVPVPFADIDVLVNFTNLENSSLSYFALLLGGTLDQFSLLAVGLAPYINASIIIQLLTGVIPSLEQLQEEGEAGTKKIGQITRRLTFPLAFLQGIGVSYFVNYYLGGNAIDLTRSTIMLVALVMSFGSLLLVWIGDLITEHGIGNGTSMIIFASIVAGISSSLYSSVSSASSPLSISLFILVFIGLLVLLCIFLVKTMKEIPVIYARQGKVQQTSILPFPLNPVGMVPIIFAIAFVSFPYLISQLFSKFGGATEGLKNSADWIEAQFNIYSNNPSWLTIIVYFVLVVFFTFFYALVQFNPEKISDNIQKRGGYIPSIRPGKETVTYITKVISHLCFWGGLGLGLLACYSYLLNRIPLLQNLFQGFGTIPVIVTGSGIIIIVGVVQDIMNKVKSEHYMNELD
ncbi:MAG: preprotein translocase subunit SecY [Candidatus Absconditabacterales bacterium]